MILWARSKGRGRYRAVVSDIPQGLLAERYRLVGPLGEGGMGRVWEARDELLGRDVAVKEISPGGLSATELGDLRERAIREARAIAQINHPNVVRIFDVVEQDDAPWIIMELIRSRSLFDVVNEDGPMDPERVAGIGLDVLGALQAAHRAGILHRDVKPANVLLADDGRTVLTDFGLATAAGDSEMTRTGVVLGSPSYLAPERALDEPAKPGADLWSLGATLFAAVEGRPPYEKSSPMATLASLMVDPPPVPQRAGALRPALEALLKKDPSERAYAEEAEKLLREASNSVEPTPKGKQPASKANEPASKANEPASKAKEPALKAKEPASKVKEEPAAKAKEPAPKDSKEPLPTSPTKELPAKTRNPVRRRMLIAVGAVVLAIGGGLGMAASTKADKSHGDPPLAAVQPSSALDSTLPAAGPGLGGGASTAPSAPAGAKPSPGATVTGNQAAPPANPGVAPTSVVAVPAANNQPVAPPDPTGTTNAPAITKTTTPAKPAATGKQVSNFATDTCLDVSGSTVQLWQCQGTDDQKVSFPSDGTMRILGKCVQINGTGNGARLSAAGCNGSSAQQFNLNKAYDLVSEKVDKCVDVPDGDDSNGVPAQIWDCAGTGNQKWHY
jgi:serine/threonine protein kinase